MCYKNVQVYYRIFLSAYFNAFVYSAFFIDLCIVFIYAMFCVSMFLLLTQFVYFIIALHHVQCLLVIWLS